MLKWLGCNSFRLRYPDLDSSEIGRDVSASSLAGYVPALEFSLIP